MTKKLDKLKQIEKLFALMSPDAMTTDDFLAQYKIVIDHVVEAKNNLMIFAKKIEKDYLAKKADLDARSSKELEKIKEQGDKELANIQAKSKVFEDKINNRLLELKDGVDGKDGKDGVDGKDADEKEIVKQVLKEFDFNDIKEEIEDLKSTISEFDEKIAAVRRSRGGGTGGNNQAVQYADLTAQCNGSTKTFTVPTARMVIALMGTQFPIIYRPVIDYTVGNKTITLTDEVSAPEAGQTLTLLYIK